MRKTLSLAIIILFCIFANMEQCYASCVYEDVNEYIIVTLSDINPVNEECHNEGDCIISSTEINGTYLLRFQHNSNPLTWSYTGSKGYSTRSPGFPGNPGNPPDIATGLKITVHYNIEPHNTLSVYAESTWGGSQFGFASYFTASAAPILSDCVWTDVIYNEQWETCLCSVGWMYIPPWTAGLGGVARVKEIPVICPPPNYNCRYDFGLFAAFGIDWWNSDVDLEDLADFCDLWLLEGPPW